MPKSLSESLAAIQDLVERVPIMFEGVESDEEAQQVIAGELEHVSAFTEAARVLPLLTAEERAEILNITDSQSLATDKLDRLQRWFREHGY